MPYKPGGGNLPQPYSTIDGQYINKFDVLNNEIRILNDAKTINDINNIIHYPTINFHSNEYCWKFVEIFKEYFKPSKTYNKDKARWLLDDDKSHGRGRFLQYSCDYKFWEVIELLDDINNNTDFDKLIFSRLNQHKDNKNLATLSVMCLTKLRNNMICTTIWNVKIVHDNIIHYELELQNLFPGGTKYYEKIKTRR